MADEMEQEELVEMAKDYLQVTYGEDTISMDVLKSTVTDGSGVLSVRCTVSWRGQRSDWRKEFYFENGYVANMSARQI